VCAWSKVPAKRPPDRRPARSTSDHREQPAASADEFEHILSVEAGGRDPYRAVAALLHLLYVTPRPPRAEHVAGGTERRARLHATPFGTPPGSSDRTNASVCGAACGLSPRTSGGRLA
jgi:hypothetical protein